MNYKRFWFLDKTLPYDFSEIVYPMYLLKKRLKPDTFRELEGYWGRLINGTGFASTHEIYTRKADDFIKTWQDVQDSFSRPELLAGGISLNKIKIFETGLKVILETSRRYDIIVWSRIEGLPKGPTKRVSILGRLRRAAGNNKSLARKFASKFAHKDKMVPSYREASYEAYCIVVRTLNPDRSFDFSPFKKNQ